MTSPSPTGADMLLAVAAEAGVDVCFANPGTTEMDLVSALDRTPGIRPVLGLFEGVVTGAADGYGRMTGRPALTLLHLGPGLANGIANLHNARRAHSPVVNLVGDHAGWHLGADAPLTSDIAAIAGAVGAVVTPTGVDELGASVRAAIDQASGPPAGVATVVLRQDLAWSEAPGVAPPAQVEHHVPSVDEVAVSAAIERLSNAPATTAVIVGGDGLTDAGVRAASRIAAATGAAVWAEMFSSRIERGGGLPTIKAVPYFPEAATEALTSVEHAVLVGTKAPVAFSATPTSRVSSCRKAARSSKSVPRAIPHPQRSGRSRTGSGLPRSLRLRSSGRPDRPAG